MRTSLAGSFGASAAIQLLNVATGVVLARQLGPSARGELAGVLLWPALLAAVGSLGLVEATTYHAARGTEPVGKIVGTSLAIAAAQSLILVGIGLGLVPAVLSHYGPSAVHAAWLFLGFIPLNLVTLYLMATLNGLHRFGSFNVLRLQVIVGSAAGLLLLAVAHRLSPRTAVFAYLGSNLVTAATAAALVGRVSLSPIGFDSSLARKLLVFGLKSHSANLSSLVNERLDQLVISAFLAPARLGLYVIAITLTSLTGLIGGSVAMVAMPTLAGLPSARERSQAARRFVALTIAISALVTVPLILLTPTLIGLFFGSAFSGAADVARVLLVAAVILSTNRVLTAILTGIGRPLDAGIGETIALAATLGGLAALLPVLGLVGAALASLLAYAVSGAWMVRRVLGPLEVGPAGLLLPERGDIERLARRCRSWRSPVDDFAAEVER